MHIHIATPPAQIAFYPINNHMYYIHVGYKVYHILHGLAKPALNSHLTIYKNKKNNNNKKRKPSPKEEYNLHKSTSILNATGLPISVVGSSISWI